MYQSKGLILTHLLDAHVHLAVAYYYGTNRCGKSGMTAMQACENAIRELMAYVEVPSDASRG